MSSRIISEEIVFNGDYELLSDLDYDIDNDNDCLIYLEETDALDKIVGVYTEDIHNDIFTVNYYGKKIGNDFSVIADVIIYDNNALFKNYPDISAKISFIYNNNDDYEIELNKEELDIIKQKFDVYLEELKSKDDIDISID